MVFQVSSTYCRNFVATAKLPCHFSPGMLPPELHIDISYRGWEEMLSSVDVSYLGGQGDVVSGLIRGITGVTIWVIGVINLLTKSP